MPTKGDPKNKGAAKRAEFAGFKQASFCPHNMTDEEKKACKAWIFDHEMADTALLRLIDGGYKVTQRWDDRGSCYCCWILSPEKHEDNPNEILAGRGSTPAKAFKQACFMHWQLFDEVWPKRDAPTSPEDYDD